MTTIKHLTLLGIFLLSSYSFSETALEKPAIDVHLENKNTIYYSGEISLQGFEMLKNTHSSSISKPKLLKINSDGGEITAGMQMGNWLRDNDYSVEVIDYCLSSCANYIFPAGRNKYLNPGSVLFWHGGAFSVNINDLKEGSEGLSRKYVENSQTMELQFYSTVGVDKNLPSYGNSESCYKLFRKNDFSGFFYSLQDMKKMGLSGIKIKGLFAKWTPIAKNHTQRNIFKVNAVIGSECDIEYVVGSSILLGKDTIKNAKEVVPMAKGNLGQIQEGDFSQLIDVIFDKHKGTIVFIKSLTSSGKLDTEGEQLKERTRLIDFCKNSKKIPFQFESFIFKNSEVMNTWHRYIKKGKTIHEIEILKSDCI